MRICIVHNEHGKFSGEEAVVRAHCRLLTGHGHQVVRVVRGSAEIPQMLFGRARAFFSGIYSFGSARSMAAVLREQRPDIAHVHNVYPLLSPSILRQCRRAGVPVVMTVHNYRLFCPNGLHLSHGRVCERCLDGREYWCVLRNCEGNLPKSIGYALRTYVARRWRFFVDNISVYCALTEFLRARMVSQGIPAERIVVIPNMIKAPPVMNGRDVGSYVAYAGRVSPEKGIHVLVEAARQSKGIPFQIAGSYARMPEVLHIAPENAQFLGERPPEAMPQFLSSSRFVVMTSVCFEGFPISVAEAMACGKAVICPRIGGLPEIVEDGVSGLLFEPGNAADLADKIRRLWESPELCLRMGRAGREKAIREYSPERYYARLMEAYRMAQAMNIAKVDGQ